MDVTIFMFLICIFAFANGVTGSESVPSTSYDTIVVGLGASGVAAASALARAGRRVLGLEAQDRFGGRVRTVPFGDGVVEMGAEWIHGEQPSRVYDFAIKNNVTLKKQNLATKFLSSTGAIKDMELFNTLMTVCEGFMEESPEIPEPIGTHITNRLMDYLRNNKPEALNDMNFIEEFLELMNIMVSNYEGCTDWKDVSNDGLYEYLEGFQHWSWHRNGYKTLFDILLNKFNEGPGLPNLDIKLNTEVVKISWPQETDGKVSVRSKEGEVFMAHDVIVTVSVGVLKARHEELFERPLPANKITAIEKIPMGVVDKIIFSFSERWWPNNYDAFLFVWKKSDRSSVPQDDLWMTKLSGTTCPLGSNNVLTLWSSGETAKFIETLSENVVKTKSLELLQKFMGANLTIPEPSSMIRTTWFSNPYIRGSYSYDDNTVVHIPDIRAALAQPLLDGGGKPRVLFAGEASDVKHFSTVHGAVDTGFREALRLLAR